MGIENFNSFIEFGSDGYRKQESVNKIKSILQKCAEDFNASAASSQTKAASALRPGETLRPLGRSEQFYTNEERDAFADRCSEYRSAALDIIEQEKKHIKSAITAAPSAEDLNALNMFKLSGGVKTAEDYQIFLEQYKDKPACYDTVVAIAAENNVHLDRHPVTRKLEDLDNLGASIARTITKAPRSGISDGSAAFVGMQVEETFLND